MALNVANTLVQNYTSFASSIRKLTTGLRVDCAADDAAGLAIRELMRADVAALNQGVRNVNDAISLVQTADGALEVIDQQLIRMKELSEQAATGTYNSVQRLMIDSEYQNVAAEITRIANATDFNGIKLLDGNTDSQAPITLNGEAIAFLEEEFAKTRSAGASGKTLFAYDPVTGQATHVTPGTTISNLVGEADGSILQKSAGAGNMGAGDYDRLEYQNSAAAVMNVLNNLLADGKQYSYLTTAETAAIASGNTYDTAVTTTGTATIDISAINRALTEATTANEDKQLLIHFGPMNDSAEDYYYIDIGCVTAQALGLGSASLYNEGNNIQTQEAAGEALVAVNDAIVSKDKIRAHLGTMQNRLEATAQNLIVQSENLSAAESRISDVDVAHEMTNYVRKQILTQAGAAMLAQANAAPQMAMSLIGE